ncbi:hypothetical protein PAF17_05540 [Paracoccus sp. Z330]|uniref:AAA+ family ATPase n=1 Tax=Paracoccus onchidii TaxID=3017813 RepID=A0ABT4ZE52_9RHOB|nr:hypothetical protein [Paracoccus onchidii]MDB6176970.1 hypothetical protein [Paracoccus onchidii]
MKQHSFIAALFFLSATMPVSAQEPEGNGSGLLQRGIENLMQDFIDDIGPDLNRLGEDMSGALSRMAPVFEDLSTMVDDMENYQMPERLENGDIIIRRRADAPPPPPLGPGLQDPDRFQTEPDIPINPDAPEIEL